MLIPLSDRASELGAEIGIMGGSGFYELLSDAIEVEIHTPYGEPAAPITVGDLAGRRVAFLPRHGRRHEFTAHRVPYRANVWAMASLGVRALIGPCSCGSLQPELHPGDFVVVDNQNPGDVYAGTWNAGLADGDFTVTRVDGSQEEQVWKDDKRVR